jgi:hypothetical protein
MFISNLLHLRQSNNFGFEIERWSDDTDFSIDHETFYHGKASLKVELDISLYSGLGLKYFPENGQHYSETSAEWFHLGFGA